MTQGAIAAIAAAAKLPEAAPGKGQKIAAPRWPAEAI